jgi:hypothetical protein
MGVKVYCDFCKIEHPIDFECEGKRLDDQLKEGGKPSVGYVRQIGVILSFCLLVLQGYLVSDAHDKTIAAQRSLIIAEESRVDALMLAHKSRDILDSLRVKKVCDE